eukprot:1142201-Pelagomonas_calceolata.AAC.3
MVAVCCHKRAPPCLPPVGSWLYVLQPRVPANTGFVVPECFECRPECASWCTILTLPIFFEDEQQKIWAQGRHTKAPKVCENPGRIPKQQN